MAWTERGDRKGARRLPEKQRRRILATYPHCWLHLPGICTNTSTQVHHIVDAEDGGADTDDNLRGVCKPCHTRYSAQESARRSALARTEWRRTPERHPGLLD